MKLFPVLFAVFLSLVTTTLQAQPVPRNVVAEHFTNTYCSVCASRNPGYNNNVGARQDIIRLSIYPSAPYAACPLSQHNKAEADARTNFYGVYGSTPRLAIGGLPLPANANYTDPAIFAAATGQMSNFTVSMRTIKEGDSLRGVAVIKKVSADTATTATFFGALAEDTLSFTAQNGENKHYNVFRRAFFGIAPLNIVLPASVGDSIIVGAKLAIHPAWNLSRMIAVGILQDAFKQVLQAGKSGIPETATGIAPMAELPATISPNPAGNLFRIIGAQHYAHATLTDLQGRSILNIWITPGETAVDISTLAPGVYFLRTLQSVHKIIKQ